MPTLSQHGKLPPHRPAQAAPAAERLATASVRAPAAMQRLLSESPRMVLQRRQVASVFGAAMQMPSVPAGAVRPASAQQRRAADVVQRMTVQFIPHKADTYVEPMTGLKHAQVNQGGLDEVDDHIEKTEGVYRHAGYALKAGEQPPDERQPNRTLKADEDLIVVAHGELRQQRQGGMDAQAMNQFVRALLPPPPEYSGTIDLLGCMTASSFISKAGRTPLAQAVSELLKPDFPSVKVRGYRGMLHPGQPDFGLNGPIEISTLSSLFGRWARFEKLLAASLADHGNPKKKAKVTRLVDSMWKSGAVRQPQPVEF